jgi:hypothetical protein
VERAGRRPTSPLNSRTESCASRNRARPRGPASRGTCGR